MKGRTPRVGSGNHRNGTSAKTVLTEVGAVRDRGADGTAGRVRPEDRAQARAPDRGVRRGDRSPVCQGLTTGEIRRTWPRSTDVEVSRDLISRVTDRVVEELAGGQSRPLDEVYPVVLIDAHLREDPGRPGRQPARLRRRGVNCAGERDVLGMWVGTGGEGAKHWMPCWRSCEPWRRRRVHRLLRWTEGSAGGDHRDLAAAPPCSCAWCTWSAPPCGMPPRTTGARSPSSCASSTPPPARGRRRARFASSKQPGAQRYPAIIRLWRSAWEQFTPFLAFPPEIRRIVYTTNAIEHSTPGSATPPDGAGTSPASRPRSRSSTWSSATPGTNRANVTGKTPGWKKALNALALYYGERITGN